MNIHHSIIGLPRSGKTTYLAALWNLIETQEVTSTLVIDRLEGDARYLNRIAHAWRECKDIGRTSQQGEAAVIIYARVPSTGQKIDLSFPDLAGESFERQFATRVVDPAYVRGFESEGGMLVFVSANAKNDGIMISSLGSELLDGGVSETGGSSPPQEIPWKHEMVPQQAQLVDLLQMVQRAPFQIRKRRLALIISAWDVVSDPDLTPAEWLGREMPFLYQYLTHNPKSFEIKIWGISAQGGDIAGALRDELLSIAPAERVRCVYETQVNHDLTEPIFWLSEAV